MRERLGQARRAERLSRSLQIVARLDPIRLLEFLRPGPVTVPMVAICHCHHPDLVPALDRAVRRLPPQVRLHVTSSRSEVFDAWLAARRKRRWGKAGPEPVFHAVENRGRDIRPFVEVSRTLALTPETLVLKIHGKKSAYSARGERWGQDLLTGLVPLRSPGSRVAARFGADPRLGLLGASQSFVSHPVYWGRNRDGVADLMERICGFRPEEGDLGFFAGTMFWLRGAALLELLPHVDLDAFEPEPLPQDGAYAHALERVIPMAARRLGWRVAELGDDAILDPDAVRHRKVAYF